MHDQRAQFLLELTGRYFADKEVRQFYYRLENNKFFFNPETFPESDDERCLDQLIYTFDVIGWAVRTGSISISEAQIFAFQAVKVLENLEVTKYLLDLDDHYKKDRRPTPAHGDAKFFVATLNAGHFNS